MRRNDQDTLSQVWTLLYRELGIARALAKLIIYVFYYLLISIQYCSTTVVLQAELSDKAISEPQTDYLGDPVQYSKK